MMSSEMTGHFSDPEKQIILEAADALARIVSDVVIELHKEHPGLDLAHSILQKWRDRYGNLSELQGIPQIVVSRFVLRLTEQVQVDLNRIQ